MTLNAASPRPPLPFLRSPRFGVYLVVTAVWLTMLTQLWLREAGQGGASLKKIGIQPEVLLVAWTDYEQWLWIERAGRHIGLTNLRIPPAKTDVAGPGGAGSQYVMQSHTRVRLPIMSLEIPAELSYEITMNTAFEMEALQGHLKLAGQEFQIQAFVENRFLYYRVRVEAAATSATAARPGGAAPGVLPGLLGQLQQVDLCGRSPLPEPIFLTEAVIPVLTHSATLKVGESWVTRAANPLSGVGHTDVRVTVEAKEKLELDGEAVEAWRVTEQVGQLRSTAWYNMQGLMIKGEMGSGLSLVQAKKSQGMLEYPDFRRDYRFTAPIERGWIRQHLDPRMDGTPLSQLLPVPPGLL